MRFLLDQGLPRSAVDALRGRGHLAEHVGDLGMSRASDLEILAVARGRGDVVVTLDADFHALLAIERALSPSVIRIRAEGLRGQGVAQIILAVVSVAQTELDAGAAVSARPGAMRLRKLPLV
jgi:predicted nuclease of predicted toxin-antitoxin system